MKCVIQVIKKLSTRQSECMCIRCGSSYVCNHYDAVRSSLGNQCKVCKAQLTTINQDTVCEALEYDPLTGEIRHKWNTVQSDKGDLATYSHGAGYLTVRIGSKEILAHRLAWLMVTGSWPEQIDHINHIRDDNRWNNLREVISRENQLNTSISRNNTSGVNGVRILPSGRFCAFIMVNRKQVSLSTYDTLEEATSKRKQADVYYGFHANHGK